MQVIYVLWQFKVARRLDASLLRAPDIASNQMVSEHFYFVEMAASIRIHPNSLCSDRHILVLDIS